MAEPPDGGGATLGAIIVTAAVVLALAAMIGFAGGLNRPLQSRTTVVASAQRPPASAPADPS